MFLISSPTEFNLYHWIVPVTIINVVFAQWWFFSVIALHLLIRILLLWFVPSTHSFHQLFLAIWTYFILLVVTQSYHYFIPILAIRSSFRLAPMSFWHVPFISDHFYVFWHQRCSRNILYFPYPQLCNQPVLRRALVSFTEELPSPRSGY